MMLVVLLLEEEEKSGQRAMTPSLPTKQQRAPPPPSKQLKTKVVLTSFGLDYASAKIGNAKNKCSLTGDLTENSCDLGRLAHIVQRNTRALVLLRSTCKI